jgi:tubulysin polyketide synthase-like protein
MVASLTPLLIRTRDAGLRLRTENGYVVVRPKDLLTSELRVELTRHKTKLLELLAWDEERAFALVQEALRYIAERHRSTGAPDFALYVLDGPEEKINEAYTREDMFALRIAVREWVEAALGEFEATNKDGSVV